MAKRSLSKKTESLSRGRLLWLHIYAPWSEESDSWRMALRADPRFEDLAKECEYYEIPVEAWIDAAQSFQAFVQFHIGYSGWPLNIFINRKGRAVFCCGSLEIPSMIQMTAALLQAYAVDSRRMDEEAEEKFKNFSENDPCAFRPRDLEDGHDLGVLQRKTLTRMLTPLEQTLDPESGLIGGDSVFHYPSILRALVLSESERSWGEKFLVKLSRSPLYDVVGGGFFRSLNRRESKTSTEKLLVENVELLDVLLEFLAIQKHPFLEEVAASTLEILRKEFRRSDGTYASALSASPDYYEWESRDLFTALGADDRGVAQKFFGITSQNRLVPFIATEVSSLSKEWNLEPLDLRLKLLDVRKKLKSFAQKHRHLARPRDFPSEKFSTAMAVGVLARAGFQWDIPELLDECLAMLTKWNPREEMGNRERWAWARAQLAVARHLAAQTRMEEARKFVTVVEDELLMESDFAKACLTESDVFGARLDLCDHLGMSAGALFLHTLLDLRALRKKGITGDRALPFNESEALALALEKSRTLGIHAGGVYSALARYLNVSS
jgi:uncharacterized protein YyaL (SSP411 family)